MEMQVLTRGREILTRPNLDGSITVLYQPQAGAGTVRPTQGGASPGGGVEMSM